MNKITITGSTGVVGRRAVRELLAAGYRVTGVTRSARGRERLERLGAHDGASIAVGPPGAYRPMLWLGDAAAAIASALRAPAGTYNVADADPPTNAEIDAALAAAAGVAALRPPTPQDGPMARSQRVSSRRLRDATGWAPNTRAGTEMWERIAA